MKKAYYVFEKLCTTYHTFFKIDIKSNINSVYYVGVDGFDQMQLETYVVKLFSYLVMSFFYLVAFCGSVYIYSVAYSSPELS